MPWKEDQFRAIMANTKDPRKRAEYASEQQASRGLDKDKLAKAVSKFHGK